MLATANQLTRSESQNQAARQARRNRITLAALLILITAMTGLGIWHVAAEMRAAQANATLTAD